MEFQENCWKRSKRPGMSVYRLVRYAKHTPIFLPIAYRKMYHLDETVSEMTHRFDKPEAFWDWLLWSDEQTLANVCLENKREASEHLNTVPNVKYEMNLFCCEGSWQPVAQKIWWKKEERIRLKIIEESYYHSMSLILKAKKSWNFTKQWSKTNLEKTTDMTCIWDYLWLLQN